MILHDGFGQRPLPEVPYGWIISRICEEFPAYTVEAAEQAWADDPTVIVDILQMRAFRDAKRSIEASNSWDDLQMTESVRRYMVIEAEVAAEMMRPKTQADE